MVGSCYWPLAYGQMPGDVEKDAEGLETMRVLGAEHGLFIESIEREVVT